jgi:LCP family protein required for cell wall assembly
MIRQSPGKKQKILIVCVSVVILVVALFLSWFYLQYQRIYVPIDKGPPIDSTPSSPTLPSSPTPAFAPGERLNLLFVGSDARPQEITAGLDARADTLLFVSLNPAMSKAFVLSIPRDSLVNIPGYGQDKINAALAYGGITLLTETVSQLLHQSIQYYVALHFESFARMVDILGGVELNVDTRMYYPREGIDLYPGLQHLNGEQSLAFVRFRFYPLGDIERVQHQQEFLRVFIDQHLNLQIVFKLPAIFSEMPSLLQTNLPFETALQLTKALSDLRSNQIRMETVPGDFYNDPQTGTSYWAVDRFSLEQLLTFWEKPKITKTGVPSTLATTTQMIELTP